MTRTARQQNQIMCLLLTPPTRLMRYHRNKRSTSLSSCGLLRYNISKWRDPSLALRCNNEARICDTVPRGMYLVLTNTHIPGDTTETTSSSSPPQSQWTAVGYSLLSALYTEKLNTQRTFSVLQNFPNWWLISATLVGLIQWDSRIVSTLKYKPTILPVTPSKMYACFLFVCLRRRQSHPGLGHLSSCI